jgi:hypothetical protein
LVFNGLKDYRIKDPPPIVFGNDSFFTAAQVLTYFFLPIIFYAFPYRVVMEEIWRSRACVAGDNLIPILQCVISSIVAILNVKRLAREIGRRRS